jgi:hypothetical protein
MILTTTLSLRGYVVGLLNANDVIDSTSIEVVHGLTTQDPYIQECYRPRPSLLIRPYKYALTRTISFGIAYLNIESRVTSLSSGTDTATHWYRPLVSQVGLTRTSRRGQLLSIEAMRLALATLISNLVASHRWRDKDTAYRIVILMLWRIRIERIYIFTDVD